MALYVILNSTVLRPFQLYCFYCMFIQLWLKRGHANVSHQIPISKIQRFSRNEICIFIFLWFYMPTILVQCDRDRVFLQIHIFSKQLRYGCKNPKKGVKSQSAKGQVQIIPQSLSPISSLARFDISFIHVLCVTLPSLSQIMFLTKFYSHLTLLSNFHLSILRVIQFNFLASSWLPSAVLMVVCIKNQLAIETCHWRNYKLVGDIYG